MNYYFAKLWLTCNQTDAACIAEFKKRFPRKLEREWNALLFQAANRKEFAAKLNKLFFKGCETWLKKDIKDSVKQFDMWTDDGEDWSLGDLGQHEGKKPFLAKLGANGAPWDFSVDGKKVKIYAHTLHHEFAKVL